MRIKSTYTTIAYAGRILLAPGMHLSEMESLSLPRHYTTQAVNVINSAAPVLDAYGNASGSMELSTRMDYPTLSAAISELVEATAHADAHQLGDLSIDIPMAEGREAQSLHYKAGLLDFAPSISRAGADKFALTLSYSFLLV